MAETYIRPWVWSPALHAPWNPPVLLYTVLVALSLPMWSHWWSSAGSGLRAPQLPALLVVPLLKNYLFKEVAFPTDLALKVMHTPLCSTIFPKLLATRSQITVSKTCIFLVINPGLYQSTRFFLFFFLKKNTSVGFETTLLSVVYWKNIL